MSSPSKSSPVEWYRRKFEACRVALEGFHVSGPLVLRHGLRIKTAKERLAYYRQMVDHFRSFEEPEKYLWLPVDPGTYIDAADLGNHSESVYPEVRKCFVEMNSGRYVEAVLTGGIGCGKTTLALYSQEYQLYLLSCLRNPHREYDLDPSSEIVFVFQNMSGKLAKAVDFERFKASIEAIPYFNTLFPYDKALTAELHFPRRIIVKPLTGNVSAAIGQNVLGGFIDELNFMQVVDKSKQVADGGVFDQAVELYNSIARRRESRFMSQGHVAGLLCLGSSKRYPGEFTERKVKEAQTNPKIYVYDKKVWEIKPPGTYSDSWFKLYCGTQTQKPRILKEDESLVGLDPKLIIEIPTDLRPHFEVDILAAMRDVAGVATFALHPFMMDNEALGAAFGRTLSILSTETCDFAGHQLKIYPRRFVLPHLPRYVHFDIGISNDSLGLSSGFVPGFVNIARSEDEVEQMPQIQFDFVLEVTPPPFGEIQLEKVRGLLYKLRELGLNIKWASMDSYQSKDTMQILHSRGFTTGYVSVDTSTVPYDVAKTAIYDRRVLAPAHDKAQMEFARLEYDAKEGKIDHPQGFSKDCSDSMAGVIYGLTYRREIWHQFGIPPTKIPKSLYARRAA